MGLSSVFSNKAVWSLLENPSSAHWSARPCRQEQNVTVCHNKFHVNMLQSQRMDEDGWIRIWHTVSASPERFPFQGFFVFVGHCTKMARNCCLCQGGQDEPQLHETKTEGDLGSHTHMLLVGRERTGGFSKRELRTAAGNPGRLHATSQVSLPQQEVWSPHEMELSCSETLLENRGLVGGHPCHPKNQCLVQETIQKGDPPHPAVLLPPPHTTPRTDHVIVSATRWQHRTASLPKQGAPSRVVNNGSQDSGTSGGVGAAACAHAPRIGLGMVQSAKPKLHVSFARLCASEDGHVPVFSCYNQVSVRQTLNNSVGQMRVHTLCSIHKEKSQ